MPEYRKKPVTIEAREFPAGADVETTRNLAEWACGWYAHPEKHPTITELPGPHKGLPFIEIPTLEGQMRAYPGDYIIKGVAGEFYPCKPDIFAKTYEAV